jgi:hypothetical protein
MSDMGVFIKLRAFPSTNQWTVGGVSRTEGVCHPPSRLLDRSVRSNGMEYQWSKPVKTLVTIRTTNQPTVFVAFNLCIELFGQTEDAMTRAWGLSF